MPINPVAANSPLMIFLTCVASILPPPPGTRITAVEAVTAPGLFVLAVMSVNT